MPLIIRFAPALAMALMLLPSSASAQWLGIGAAWSAPGSTGVVDEANMTHVLFDQAKASVRPSAPVGTLVWLRYPVVLSASWMYWSPIAPHNVLGYYTHAKLTLSFQRNDESALILASLRRVSLTTGETTLMMSVDGLASPPSADLQTVTANLTCGDEGCIRPDIYAYWVEVALWKVKAASDPKVVAVGVHLTP